RLPLRARGFGDEARPAVAADVREAAQRAARAPHDEERAPRVVVSQEVARPRELRGVGDDEREPREEPRALPGEERRVRVARDGRRAARPLRHVRRPRLEEGEDPLDRALLERSRETRRLFHARWLYRKITARDMPHFEVIGPDKKKRKVTLTEKL